MAIVAKVNTDLSESRSNATPVRLEEYVPDRSPVFDDDDGENGDVDKPDKPPETPKGVERLDDGRSIVTLLWPIEWNGKRIVSAELHHPTGAEIGRANHKGKFDKKAGEKDGYDVALHLIAAVSSIPYTAVQQFRGGDLNRISRELDFLQKA